MSPRVKFSIVTVVTLGVLVWLGVAGINETKTYYVTVEELHAMGDAQDRRLRVGGDVEPGSIVRKADRVEFTITQEDRKLSVVYVGRDPLPDTFRDRAQALCDGKLRGDQVFEARKIQAKCTSKYEADPGGGAKPVHEPTPDREASL